MQEGAEQLLAAAGLGEERVGNVAQSIVQAAEAATRSSRRPPEPQAEADTSTEDDGDSGG